MADFIRFNMVRGVSAKSVIVYTRFDNNSTVFLMVSRLLEHWVLKRLSAMPSPRSGWCNDAAGLAHSRVGPFHGISWPLGSARIQRCCRHLQIRLSHASRKRSLHLDCQP